MECRFAVFPVFTNASKGKGSNVLVYATKLQIYVEVWLHSFSILVLEGREWSVSRYVIL